MASPRRTVIAGVAVVAVAAIFGIFLSPWAAPSRRAVQAQLASLGLMPAPVTDAGVQAAAKQLPVLPATGWHDGGPLTADSLRGRVVVLAVFSDTHPSAFDVLPRIEIWHEAYARFGVRIVGVHAPEFAFATEPAVTAHFAARLGLRFPIVEDPSLGVLRALGGTGGEVMLALAGPDGRLADVRAVRDPEAGLAAVERELRALLRAQHPGRVFPGDGAAPPAAAAGRAPVRTVRLGAAAVTEGPLRGAEPGRAQPFTAPFRFEIEGDPYVPSPVGWWTPRAEGLEAARGGAAQFVAIRYDAARVGVVASPPASGPSKLWILRDDEWLPADALGADARRDAHGASYVVVDAPGWYDVARGRGTHVLKISPEAAGLTLYALTFGPGGEPSGGR